MSSSELVAPHHLDRLALIYVRQSSPRQVLTNQESLRLQYALQHRAQELGWSETRIEVIDADLGLTAASAQHRTGFQDLVTRVTLGQVGIILSVDVTRLARNCSDWYPLLDVCGFRSCLIADRDGVYDPASTNGRLLLGLKGQISELELATIRARLTAGLLNKAQRGDLALQLPIGLVRDERGVVCKDPNLEVQERIELVFETFLAVRSAGKVVKAFIEQGLTLPRRDRFGDVIWRRPTANAILLLLRNPAYTGTFVYGRHQSIRSSLSARRPLQRVQPMAAWRIRVPNKYPAYVDWSRYEKIQMMLDDNRAEYTRDRTRGVPRAGEALLQGIIYCGASGHKLSVRYRPDAQYRCVEERRRYGGSLCQVIPAAPVDTCVRDAFFAALQPAELDLYAQVTREHRASTDRSTRAQAQQVERLRYEAALAERQFRRVDPDNRLVAAELERRWEDALRALQRAEAAHAEQASAIPPPPLDPALRAALLDLGQRLPAIWQTGLLAREQQKALLRCLIEKVVVERAQRDCIHTRIVWRGGDTSTFDVPIAVGAFSALTGAAEMEAQILDLIHQGYTDAEIATYLTAAGLRSPRRLVVIESTVRNLRLKHRIRRPHPLTHPQRPAGYLSIRYLASQLDVPEQWLYARIHYRQIEVARDPATKLYLFPDHPDTLVQLHWLKTGTVQHVRLYKEQHDA